MLTNNQEALLLEVSLHERDVARHFLEKSLASLASVNNAHLLIDEIAEGMRQELHRITDII